MEVKEIIEEINADIKRYKEMHETAKYCTIDRAFYLGVVSGLKSARNWFIYLSRKNKD